LEEENMILEMIIVNQLLVGNSSPSKRLSNVNTEDISSKCFSLYSKTVKFDSHDEDITKLLLVCSQCYLTCPNLNPQGKIFPHHVRGWD
jgi:hypothetical protein